MAERMEMEEFPRSRSIKDQISKSENTLIKGTLDLNFHEYMLTNYTGFMYPSTIRNKALFTVKSNFNLTIFFW